MYLILIFYQFYFQNLYTDYTKIISDEYGYENHYMADK